MNDHFAPMMKRALLLASKVDKGNPCFPVAVAQIVDTIGVPRLIDFASPSKPIAEAEEDVMAIARGIPKIPSTSIVTITCKTEPPQSTYAGFMSIHFDHRSGYSSTEVIPYKLDSKGMMLLYQQTPGEPLEVFAKAKTQSLPTDPVK